ncbi:MAG TPA: hypothetical protein DIS79_06200 [Bacteroidetes bacterium]|nr:hypothetical protein [Bacteroidota bacterium]HRK05284.1 hypothetical protein [Chlorobiota bacterium]
MAGTAWLQLDDAEPFPAGSRVLVLQMKSADTTALVRGSDGYLKREPNAVGNWMALTVAERRGNSVRVAEQLGDYFDVDGTIQIVRIVAGGNVTITGNHIVGIWNGKTGGVVALEAEDTLTIDAPIIVTGRGYLGGLNSSFGDRYCSDYGETSTFETGRHGMPGESFGPRETVMAGRRNRETGGGGGGSSRAGGGGGANAGYGGKGGCSERRCDNPTPQSNGGVGGYAVIQDPNRARLLMGGGGGGGHRLSQPGSAGGRGGGVIYVKARVLNMAPAAILFAGGSNSNIVIDDEGGGGGGAGGTVYLDVAAYASRCSVTVHGGDGVDTRGNIRAGVGGGGGGGWVLSRQSLDFTRVDIDRRAGRTGTELTNNSFVCASDGSEGELLENVNIFNVNCPIDTIDNDPPDTTDNDPPDTTDNDPPDTTDNAEPCTSRAVLNVEQPVYGATTAITITIPLRPSPLNLPRPWSARLSLPRWMLIRTVTGATIDTTAGDILLVGSWDGSDRLLTMNVTPLLNPETEAQISVSDLRWSDTCLIDSVLSETIRIDPTCAGLRRMIAFRAMPSVVTSNGELHISNITDGTTIEVYDLSGRLLYAVESTSNEVVVRDLPVGPVYVRTRR